MGVPGSVNNLLGISAGGYQISRSLRFNSADSAYLSRTPGSAGNRKTWTWAGWVKRSAVGSGTYAIADARTGSNESPIMFGETTADTLSVYEYSGGFVWQLRTTQVFRDPSAWFHLCIAVDTTQATASNRVKIYVNGSEVTAFAVSTYPSQNHDTFWSTTNVHTIGAKALINTYFNGYLADVFFIDGSALTPSSFTETDATTGQLIPKAYTGSYGTNGFHLEFADNSAATATTLGKDTSGNSNNWTPNNLSVTAGAGNDSLVDSPTNYGTDTGAGGEVRGNYATFNPLKTGDTTSFAQGNLSWRTTSNGPDRCVLATIGMPSGKWYWECYMDEGTATAVGVALDSVSVTTGGAGSNSYVYYSIGKYYNNGADVGSPTSFTTGDLISVAFDADTGKLWFAKNGTWLGSGDPGAGTNPAMTLTTGLTYFPLVGDSGGASQSQVTANFGQRAFAYTNNRSGFKALCDTNLTAPVIAKPNTAFDVVTYTGNGSARSITLPGGFSPDLIWTKSRSAAYFHHLYDIVRGTNSDLCSNSTTNELTGSPYNDGVTAFNSSGYSLGTFNGLNENGTTYVAWAWDGGSSTVTNTQGSITSQVRANPGAGFSICTFSIASASATISTFGHGLGVAPSFVILKVRNVADEWTVYHGSISSPTSNWVTLNTTNAAGGGVDTFSTSSTTFGIRETRLLASGTSGDILAYCFAPVAGYSSISSWTGNGSSDGVFVYTGMRPKFLLWKNTSSVANWYIYDTSRSTYNVVNLNLEPNTLDAENTLTSMNVDFLSNGFKIRGSDGDINGNGSTYVYLALAESPFNYSRAR